MVDLPPLDDETPVIAESDSQASQLYYAWKLKAENPLIAGTPQAKEAYDAFIKQGIGTLGDDAIKAYNQGILYMKLPGRIKTGVGPDGQPIFSDQIAFKIPTQAYEEIKSAINNKLEADNAPELMKAKVKEAIAKADAQRIQADYAAKSTQAQIDQAEASAKASLASAEAQKEQAALLHVQAEATKQGLEMERHLPRNADEAMLQENAYLAGQESPPTALEMGDMLRYGRSRFKSLDIEPISNNPAVEKARAKAGYTRETITVGDKKQVFDVRLTPQGH